MSHTAKAEEGRKQSPASPLTEAAGKPRQFVLWPIKPVLEPLRDTGTKRQKVWTGKRRKRGS